MKNHKAVMFGVFVAALFLGTGCSKQSDGGPNADANPPAGVTNEATSMQTQAISDAFVGNDELTFADQAVQPSTYGTFGKIDAAVTPLRWGRFITSVTRTATTTVQAGDTLALTHVAKIVSGTFKIKGINGTGDTVTVSKPFADTSSRNILFKRVNKNPAKFWRNWVPVATSLVAGGTSPAPAGNQISIKRVDLYLPTGDTITVTDPVDYYLRYKWLKLFRGGRKDVPVLTPGDQVIIKVTVVSASSDTDMVALRYGFDMSHRRRELIPMISQVQNGDNTFTREYQTAWFVHFHHGDFNAGVDAMTRGTVYDDTAPYSVSWWGIPYRVN